MGGIVLYISHMKIRLLLISLLVYSAMAAQGSAVVEYQLFNDTYFPTTLFAALHVNESVSIYQEKTSTVQRWTEREDKLNGATVVNPSLIFEPYFKIDRNKKEMFFFDIISGNSFLIKDNYTELDWDISTETKTMAGFLCTKATTTFRGRQWIAWFTIDIPLPFGPWKLHGLPGLILEAHDATNKYLMRAVKIDFQKSLIFDKDFNKLIEVKNTQPLSYEQFLKNRDEAMDNFNAKLNKKGDATITRQKMPRSGMELTFEWEE